MREFKTLIQEANRWNQANILRKYIYAVEENLNENKKLLEESQNWISWAREKADWLDPTIKKDNPLFEDMNLKELIKKRFNLKNLNP